jgi:hypothetical protein
MYTILNKNSSVPTAQRKWNTVFDINSNEWKQIKNVWFMYLSPNQEFTCPRRFCTFLQPQKMCSIVSFSFWQKFVPSSLQNIFRSYKGSKDMYTILNKNSSTSFPTAQRKWNTVFDINSNEFFKNVWFMFLSPNQAFTCPRRFCTFLQPQKM